MKTIASMIFSRKKPTSRNKPNLGWTRSCLTSKTKFHLLFDIV